MFLIELVHHMIAYNTGWWAMNIIESSKTPPNASEVFAIHNIPWNDRIEE